MASEGLEHLAYDGHAHDLAHEAEEMGWMVLAESFDEISALLQTAGNHPELGVPLPQLCPEVQPEPGLVHRFQRLRRPR